MLGPPSEKRARKKLVTARQSMASVASNVLRFDTLLHLGILWPLAVIFSYVKLFFEKLCTSAAVSFPRSSPENAPVQGLACIVSGASSGIGKATAEALALHGYHVILAGRSMPRLLEATIELKKKHGGISVEALELDLRSTTSILTFKNAVLTSLQDSQPARDLQLLVNNAGILACSERWTVEGFDSMMASNYLGPYLLTQQLLPILHKGSAARARIVNVVSFTHRCVQALKVDEEQLTQGCHFSTGNWYKLAHIYEISKLCLLLFTYELHRRYSIEPAASNISIMAADPGIVQTNIMRELPAWLEWLAYFVLKIFGAVQSPQVGAEAVIDAALAPQGISGVYFFGGQGRTLKSSSLSYDLSLMKKLWEISSSLCSQSLSRHRSYQ